MNPTPDHLLTDHAVVRYAERVMGIPVRQAVAERLFASGKRAEVVQKIRNGRVRLGDSDVWLVVEEGVIVTVVVKDRPNGQEPKVEHT